MTIPQPDPRFGINDAQWLAIGAGWLKLLKYKKYHGRADALLIAHARAVLMADETQEAA